MLHPRRKASHPIQCVPLARIEPISVRDQQSSSLIPQPHCPYTLYTQFQKKVCTFLFFHFDKTYRSRISNTSFIMYTILLSIECTVNAQTIEHKLLSILMPNIIIFLLKVIHKINKNLSAHFLLELSIFPLTFFLGNNIGCNK